VLIKKFEVKSFWSPDIRNYNPWAWEPDDNEVFYLLEMKIGFAGEEASDVYSIIVATPEGILEKFSKRKHFDETYKIIIQKEYSWKNIVSHINYLISTIDTLYEYEAYSCLRDYFHWEHANYVSLTNR